MGSYDICVSNVPITNCNNPRCMGMLLYDLATETNLLHEQQSPAYRISRRYKLLRCFGHSKGTCN
jgi:hypothetical protein